MGDLAGAENTMAAFRRAVEEGYRYLETDVHATSDGVPVILHDPILDQVSNLSGAVGALPWSKVRQAEIAGRHRVPTFAEFLEFLAAHPEVAANVDCKSAAALEPLAQALTECGPLAKRITVAAFSDQRLRLLQRRLGDRVNWSMGPREIARLAFGRPVPPGSIRPAAAQVPPRFRHWRVVTGGFVRRAHSQGVEVHVWTIDDSDHMHQHLDLGVDGIFTDRPDRLRAVLRDRGQWPE